MDESSMSPAESLVAAAHRSMHGFRHAPFEGDADFFNTYARDACPLCGGDRVVRNGARRDGTQKYACRSCGGSFTPATGTIFDNAKLPVTAWADFILQAISYESVAAMTREDRGAETTPPYWMAKLFAVLEDVQGDTVLSGTVCLDETYWPVAARDAARGPDGKLPRGLSRNQICIGVAVDDSGRAYVRREGLGKTSKSKTWDAFGARIEEGSRPRHGGRARRPRLEARVGKRAAQLEAPQGVPDELNPLEPVNRIRFLLKRFLGFHSGFNRDDLRGYLDLFSVAVNAPEDKLEKVAMVLDRAMRCPKTLRFRDLYNVNASSDKD